ncbi:MAG: hypothetical protein ACI9Y7_000143 [Dokdonia sp.]|jgi:hypothetical protein
MLSTRSAFSCIGRTSGTSVLRDLFGYSEVPKEISLRAQIEALENKHYHVNVIMVAPENYFSGARRQICYSLQVTREVFSDVNFGIGRIEWYQISEAEAGDLSVTDSEGEAEELTSDWTVPNDGLDLFVVRLMTDTDGWSAVNGSCDKDSKGFTGSVVELYSGDDNYAANGFAHEMGHYLGLNHIADPNNFIGGNGSSNSNTAIMNSQGNIMKSHCFVKDGCDNTM